jgi:hypothetical protein
MREALGYDDWGCGGRGNGLKSWAAFVGDLPLGCYDACIQTCAAKEATGEKITPAVLPLPEAERGEFVTGDYIKV